MGKKFFMTGVLVVAAVLFVAAGVVAFRHLLFPPSSSPVFPQGVAKQVVAEEPIVWAGATVRNPLTAIGDDVEVVVVVQYPRGTITDEDDPLKKISFKPFEVRSREVTRGKVAGGDNVFVAATYHIQCVTCVPGFVYPIAPFPLELHTLQGAVIRSDLPVSPGFIVVDFRYNRDYPELRGIKQMEKITTQPFLGLGLIGGGMIMGVAVILRGGLNAIRAFMGRKRFVRDPLVQKLSDDVALFQRRFLGEGADTRRIVHDMYLALSRFMYKKCGVDIMQEYVALPADTPESVKKTVSFCEASYNRIPPSHKNVEELLSLLRDIVRWYDGEGGTACP